MTRLDSTDSTLAKKACGDSRRELGVRSYGLGPRLDTDDSLVKDDGNASLDLLVLVPVGIRSLL